MKYAEVVGNTGRLVGGMPPQDEFIHELLLKKKVWFKNVAQASRLQSVPQASRLPRGAESPQDVGGTEPSDNEQAGRLLYAEIDRMKTAKGAKTHDPRFLIVVDGYREETVKYLSATAGRSPTIPAPQNQPFGELRDMEGLVKLVDHEELASNDWSLTPGRYVGVAPEEVDENFDFEELGI